jgi:hypothetical protein
MKAENELQLLGGLEEAIQEFMDGACETPAWDALDTYVPPETAQLMAEAAWSVLIGISKLSKYLRSEGHDV